MLLLHLGLWILYFLIIRFFPPLGGQLLHARQLLPHPPEADPPPLPQAPHHHGAQIFAQAQGGKELLRPHGRGHRVPQVRF